MGAVGGMVCGGAAGALVGVVPALFTFGLSIPIGAVVGGGAGLFLGGAAGTSVGFAGGGAVGLTGYTLQSNGVTGTLQSVQQGAVKVLMLGKAAIGFGGPKEANIELVKEPVLKKQQ